jgi:hypothetical protein
MRMSHPSLFGEGPGERLFPERTALFVIAKGVDGYIVRWYTLPSRLLHGQRACVD